MSVEDSMIFDIHGNDILDSRRERFRNGIRVNYKRDDATGAFYTHTIIPQKNPFGEKQFPFVYWHNYPNGGIESAYQINMREDFLVIMNSGRYNSPFGAGVTLTGLPRGTVIQNGVVLQQGDANNASPTKDWVLTINSSGELGYAKYADSASEMVSNGVVSAVSGFIPLITNYMNIEDVEESDTDVINIEADGQRQILGQYDNGDYAIITTEARGFQGGGWFTIKQLQTLCRQLGLKFAFDLDGGGSTETVIGKRQLNPFYENTYGRVNPTYIIFNGTTTFPLVH